MNDMKKYVRWGSKNELTVLIICVPVNVSVLAAIAGIESVSIPQQYNYICHFPRFNRPKSEGSGDFSRSAQFL